ncbi:hypothetical protein IFM53868_06524 [Aspergillus udagawae]|uniref:Uncharacterized protein n=1 Tax=Aspergillus udagawae TaxID=91492 RepID=A0ABQ1B0J7_9EURO|nr:hypothetical protein IFM53868_06524 [Aspergillus udagawae]GFG16469.1 hypothetical protein IFM5058_07973 [Aspergillus udagawae]
MAAIQAATKIRDKLYPPVANPTTEKRLPPQIEFDDSDDEVDEFSGIDLDDYVAWCMERHTTWRAIKILNRRSDGRLFERGDDAPHQAASTGGFSILRA